MCWPSTEPGRHCGARIESAARWKRPGEVMVTLKSDTFLQSVAIDCLGFTPDDNTTSVRAPAIPENRSR